MEAAPPSPPAPGRRRRAPGRALAVVLGALALGAGPAGPAAATHATVAPPPRCGCAVLLDPAHDTRVDAETVVLRWDGTTETVLLQLDVDTSAASVGIVVPTPAPATVELADPAVVDDLLRLTQAEPDVVGERWWPEIGFGGEDDDEPAPQAPAPAVGLAPVVAAAVPAADQAGVDAWLAAQGYLLPPSFGGTAAQYVAEGWTLNLVHLAAADGAADGRLQPVRLTFPSPALVYPARLAAASSRTQDVRTVVLADHRTERTDPTKDTADVELLFAGPVDPEAATSGELAAMLREDGYVTVQQQSWFDPPAQVVSDLQFAAAADDAPFVDTYRHVADRRIGPFHAGPALVLAGFVALAALGAVVHLRSRRGTRAR